MKQALSNVVVVLLGLLLCRYGRWFSVWDTAGNMICGTTYRMLRRGETFFVGLGGACAEKCRRNIGLSVNLKRCAGGCCPLLLAVQHFSLVENLTDVGVIVEHPVNVKRIVF